MCPDLTVTRSANERRWRRLIAVLLVILALVVSFAIVARLNAFGENVTGTVQCANSPVSGVFIEAARAPRILGTDREFQSRFASWRPLQPDGTVAAFHFWLPYGGAYSVRFGCGMFLTPERDWMFEGRMPFVQGTGYSWRCNDPKTTPLSTYQMTECRLN